jgi:type IV pilus assembly protein PilW
MRQLTDNRRLLVETQVQQDLRATADLIARDLRRAGFWWNAQRASAQGSGAAGTMANPYTDLLPADDGDTAQEVTYRYAHPNQVDDDAVADDERLGYRLRNSVIETQLGAGNWQAITDSGALKVTTFNVSLNKQDVPLACHLACSPGGGSVCPPVQSVRAYTIAIEGEAASDPAVKRSVRSHVRLRNDLIIGECRD